MTIVNKYVNINMTDVKAKNSVELYPHFEDIMSGIPDEFGNNQPFPAAFRKTRGNPRKPKGIIKIVKQAVH